MKRILFSAAAFVTAACLFTSCKPKTERLDDIVKDLSADSYSLHFDKAYPDYGITKTSYGAESYIVYADADSICPEPWRIRFPHGRVPVVRFPTLRPTSPCPDFVPLDIGERVKRIFTEADPQQFSGIRNIQLVNNKNVLLANNKFTDQYASLKPDMIDDSVLNGLDYNKFLLLESPDNLTPGFTRNFYGYADLNDIISSKKIDIGGIFRPTVVIGCQKIPDLDRIRERLTAVNPAVYKSLQLTRLDQDSAVGVLSFQQ